MKHDELIARLQRTTSHELPDPEQLLERAFPLVEHAPAPEVVRPLAAAALALASTAPLWLEPAEIDRERSETMITAAVETARACARDWNQAMKRND